MWTDKNRHSESDAIRYNGNGPKLKSADTIHRWTLQNWIGSAKSAKINKLSVIWSRKLTFASCRLARHSCETRPANIKGFREHTHTHTLALIGNWAKPFEINNSDLDLQNGALKCELARNCNPKKGQKEQERACYNLSSHWVVLSKQTNKQRSFLLAANSIR